MADIRTWNKELIVELLAMYKSFPCLWKIRSEEYKNKNLKEEAYKKIVDYVKEKGFPNANRDFIVKKFQSLRGVWKELKKVVDSQRSGRGTDDVYKSSLWYYDNLLFTKDQELPTNSISNIDEDLEDESRSNDDFHQNVIPTNEGAITEIGAGGTGQQSKVTDAAPAATASTPQRMKRKATTNYQAEFFKVCTDTLKSTSKELPEFDVAGINMAKKLAKMDPVQAIYAESIINNVLRKGLLKKLTEDTDLCDNVCNKRIQIQTPISVDLQSTSSSYTSQSILQNFPSTSNEEVFQDHSLRTFYESSNLDEEN